MAAAQPRLSALPPGRLVCCGGLVLLAAVAVTAGGRGEVVLGLGSAGSNRIRSAILDTIVRVLEQGMDAYRAGDLDLAVAKLREGLGVDPGSFQLHYHLGLVLGRGEDIFDAIQELETAVDLQPRHFAALKNLAILYQRAGFKYKAIEMWERALGNSPDDETRQGIKEHLMALL